MTIIERFRKEMSHTKSGLIGGLDIKLFETLDCDHHFGIFVIENSAKNTAANFTWFSCYMFSCEIET